MQSSQTSLAPRPLAGVAVIELEAQGPLPFAGMLLTDLGAEVILVERPGGPQRPPGAHERGRRRMVLDLKSTAGREAVLDLVTGADVLLEGYRPGVLERLGLSPEECWGRNQKLVVGRMTGWGQDGQLATKAGHDINYLALTGALHAIGPADGAPVPPLNLVADYPGGIALALGVVAAVLDARTTNRGRVVDTAMVDVVGAMLAPFHGMQAAGAWSDERGSNFLDGGAPFYAVYETSDGRHLAVGAIEMPFREALYDAVGLSAEDLAASNDVSQWPKQRARLAAAVGTRSLAEWTALLETTDACATPVLTLAEARAHPHARMRDSFSDRGGVPHPAAVPRFGAPAPVTHRQEARR